jgi:hypothetical protein
MSRHFMSKRNRMHYVTHRSDQFQKHMFGVTCLGAVFVKSVLVPHENEIYCDHISCPGHIGMHYLPRRSHRIQINKFGVTCPGTLFMETAPGPPEHEK